MTKHGLQNTTQKAKDWTTQTQLQNWRVSSSIITNAV